MVTTRPRSPPALAKALRASGCFACVALKLWSEADGRAQLHVVTTPGFRDEVNAKIEKRKRAPTEDNVAHDVERILAKRLRFSIDGIELSSTFALGVAEGEEARCPPSFSLFVDLSDVERESDHVRPQSTDATLDDFFSPFRGETSIYAAIVDGNVDDLKWTPTPDARRIVAVASAAWRAGAGTFREVADALNAAGLVSLKTRKPFDGASVTNVLVAVELVDGSADVDEDAAGRDVG